METPTPLHCHDTYPRPPSPSHTRARLFPSLDSKRTLHFLLTAPHHTQRRYQLRTTLFALGTKRKGEQKSAADASLPSTPNKKGTAIRVGNTNIYTTQQPKKNMYTHNSTGDGRASDEAAPRHVEHHNYGYLWALHNASHPAFLLSPIPPLTPCEKRSRIASLCRAALAHQGKYRIVTAE